MVRRSPCRDIHDDDDDDDDDNYQIVMTIIMVLMTETAETLKVTIKDEPKVS